MIFVTVGSQKFQFNRLLKAIDSLIANEGITETVYAQSGVSDYKPEHYECEPFLDREKFTEAIEQSDIIITHGGTGTIVEALKAGKKVIAVPRRTKYGEHVDDHQVQLIDQFVNSNLIYKCENLKDLGIIINDIKSKNFDQYESNTYKYIEVIGSYIDGLK